MSIWASQPTLSSGCSHWSRSNARSSSAASPSSDRHRLSPPLPLHLGGFSWLIFLQSFRFIKRRATQLYLLWGSFKIVFCSSLSAVGCSWHIMTFSLEFSWITWIPLPPGPGPEPAVTGASWPRLVMKHFVSRCHSAELSHRDKNQAQLLTAECALCSHPPPPPGVFLLLNEDLDNYCYMSSLFK